MVYRDEVGIGQQGTITRRSTHGILKESLLPSDYRRNVGIVEMLQSFDDICESTGPCK